MKSKLQYAYSISVLIGVLVTAFLMMNRANNEGLPFRSSTPSYRLEARVADPAVSRLLQVEEAFHELVLSKDKKDERFPADNLDRMQKR